MNAAEMMRLFADGGSYRHLRFCEVVWLRRAHLMAAEQRTHPPQGKIGEVAREHHLNAAADCYAAIVGKEDRAGEEVIKKHRDRPLLGSDASPGGGGMSAAEKVSSETVNCTLARITRASLPQLLANGNEELCVIPARN